MPDGTLARPDQVSERGLEGAELAVEVLSPGDESLDKFGFYAKLGVREVWIIDTKTCATEIFTLANGDYATVPFVNASAPSPLLDIRLEITGVSAPPSRRCGHLRRRAVGR